MVDLCALDHSGCLSSEDMARVTKLEQGIRLLYQNHKSLRPLPAFLEVDTSSLHAMLAGSGRVPYIPQAQCVAVEASGSSRWVRSILRSDPDAIALDLLPDLDAVAALIEAAQCGYAVYASALAKPWVEVLGDSAVGMAAHVPSLVPGRSNALFLQPHPTRDAQPYLRAVLELLACGTESSGNVGTGLLWNSPEAYALAAALQSGTDSASVEDVLLKAQDAHLSSSEREALGVLGKEFRGSLDDLVEAVSLVNR